VPEKGPDAQNTVSKSLNGSYKLMFASKPGSPAVGGFNGLSTATESFLRYYNTIPVNKIVFPSAFSDWANPEGENLD